jgi:hypothetical protein
VFAHSPLGATPLATIYNEEEVGRGNRRTVMTSLIDHNLRERDSSAAYGGSNFRIISDLADTDSHLISMDLGVESALSSRFRGSFKEMFRDG